MRGTDGRELGRVEVTHTDFSYESIPCEQRLKWAEEHCEALIKHRRDPFISYLWGVVTGGLIVVLIWLIAVVGR